LVAKTQKSKRDLSREVGVPGVGDAFPVVVGLELPDFEEFAGVGDFFCLRGR
jgi:hypothetical protein